MFVEFWSTNQTQNYVGSARAPAAINLDKNLNTQWYNVGFSYNFNRDWGVMVRSHRQPHFDHRHRGIRRDSALQCQRHRRHRSDGHVHRLLQRHVHRAPVRAEVSVRAPTARPGSTATIKSERAAPISMLGAFHRGLLSGDNAWQYYSQVLGRLPFLYRSAADPQGFFDGNAGVVQTYMPGIQIDGSVGIVYNNLVPRARPRQDHAARSGHHLAP